MTATAKKMYAETIKLSNAYGNRVELIRVEDNKYRYETDAPYEALYSPHGHLEGIEVSGGPYVEEGGLIEGGYMVEKILYDKTEKAFYLILE